MPPARLSGFSMCWPIWKPDMVFMRPSETMTTAIIRSGRVPKPSRRIWKTCMIFIATCNGSCLIMQMTSWKRTGKSWLLWAWRTGVLTRASRKGETWRKRCREQKIRRWSSCSRTTLLTSARRWWRNILKLILLLQDTPTACSLASKYRGWNGRRPNTCISIGPDCMRITATGNHNISM